MGSYKRGYKSRNMGYKYSYPNKRGYKSRNMGCKYSYPTYNPTYNYQVLTDTLRLFGPPCLL